MMRWYVVQTKPKQEARAEANLMYWHVEALARKVATAPTGQGELVVRARGPDRLSDTAGSRFTGSVPNSPKSIGCSRPPSYGVAGAPAS